MGALFAATLLLSGCVWLRLLDLKNQFADFDRWIEVPDNAGLELRFRRPLLLGEDLDTLIRGLPTATVVGPEVTVNSYAFTHVPAEGGPDPASAERILVLTTGIRAGRLAFVDLPPAIFRVIPRELALRAMRSLGHVAVNRIERNATTAVDFTGVTTTLPTGDELVALFGRPNQISEQAGRLRVLWRYRLAGTSLREDGKPVIGAMAFCFTPGPQPFGAQRPTRFQVNVNGLWLYLDLPATVDLQPDAAPDAGPRQPPAGVAPDPQATPPRSR